MTRRGDIRESDLYAPVRAFLERLGYTVQGEVAHCDLTARRGDELVIVELKRRPGIDLLVQATDRQRICPSVYVALPGPLDRARGSRRRGVERLLRQLELGLILVTFGPGEPRVDLVFHPIPYERKRSGARRRAVLREMEGRSSSYNTGGSSGCKLITAYRESAIRIACALEQGQSTPRQLRALGCGEKTQSILAANHYGWFERIERGVYALSSCGRRELVDYAEIAERWRCLSQAT